MIDYGNRRTVNPDMNNERPVVGALIIRSPEAMLNMRWRTPTYRYSKLRSCILDLAELYGLGRRKEIRHHRLIMNSIVVGVFQED